MDNKITDEIGQGKPGPGRPKGALNKTTQLAKDAIAMAAEGLGGTDRLIAWAREDAQNERVFWGTIYTKLLPLQVNAELAGKVVAEVTHRIIDSATD
jgi:hypothetical protein